MVTYAPPDTYPLVSAQDFSSDTMPDGALLDTNILIDFLKGESKARDVFEEYAELYTSVICYMEVMTGCKTPAEEIHATRMFQMIKLLPVLDPIEDVAVALRKHRIGESHVAGKTKLKIPDAIIYATALVNVLIVVTRNAKDFKPPPLSVLARFSLIAVAIKAAY